MVSLYGTVRALIKVSSKQASFIGRWRANLEQIESKLHYWYLVSLTSSFVIFAQCHCITGDPSSILRSPVTQWHRAKIEKYRRSHELAGPSSAFSKHQCFISWIACSFSRAAVIFNGSSKSAVHFICSWRWRTFRSVDPRADDVLLAFPLRLQVIILLVATVRHCNVKLYLLLAQFRTFLCKGIPLGVLAPYSKLCFV